MYRLIGSIVSEELTKNLKLLYGSNMDKIDRRSKHLISDLDRVNHRIFLPHPPKLDAYSLLSYQNMFWGLSSTKSLFDSCGKNRIPPQFFNDFIIAKKKINLHSTIHEICCTDYFIIYAYEVLSNNWCMHVYFMVYTARTTIKNNILKLAVNDVIVAQRGNRPRLRSFLWFSPFWRSVVQWQGRL